MPVSQIIHGDCVAEMAKMPEASEEEYGLPCDCIDCGETMKTLEDWEHHEPCRRAYLDYVERWGGVES
jgi:hypothetical protein